MSKTLLAKVALRRGSYQNYSNSFIPIKGEVCFVDTTNNGLRFKVGDGVTTWRNLPYIDEQIYSAIDKVIQSGYYEDGVFYTDKGHSARYDAAMDTIYIDIEASLIYVYDGTNYVSIRDMIPKANSMQTGTVKLYTEMGQSEDGTMTQKAITDELNKKLEATVDSDDEKLVLTTN